MVRVGEGVESGGCRLLRRWATLYFQSLKKTPPCRTIFSRPMLYSYLLLITGLFTPVLSTCLSTPFASNDEPCHHTSQTIIPESSASQNTTSAALRDELRSGLALLVSSLNNVLGFVSTVLPQFRPKANVCSQFGCKPTDSVKRGDSISAGILTTSRRAGIGVACLASRWK
jgi:hypothetical protein